MTENDGKQNHGARRSRRSTRVQPDIIDRLDNIDGFHYHHEGPFDPVCRERNTSAKKSPIDALRTSNEEALRATPRDKILDSILGHRPLDGVAFYPPGTTDRFGQTYDYEEGYNMMTEDRGNFKRWPGVVGSVAIVGRPKLTRVLYSPSSRNSETKISRTTHYTYR
jgi:hypothetical protein